jgi:hypothetical protein
MNPSIRPCACTLSSRRSRPFALTRHRTHALALSLIHNIYLTLSYSVSHSGSHTLIYTLAQSHSRAYAPSFQSDSLLNPSLLLSHDFTLIFIYDHVLTFTHSLIRSYALTLSLSYSHSRPFTLTYQRTHALTSKSHSFQLIHTHALTPSPSCSLIPV